MSCSDSGDLGTQKVERTPGQCRPGALFPAACAVSPLQPDLSSVPGPAVLRLTPQRIVLLLLGALLSASNIFGFAFKSSRWNGEAGNIFRAEERKMHFKPSKKAAIPNTKRKGSWKKTVYFAHVRKLCQIEGINNFATWSFTPCLGTKATADPPQVWILRAEKGRFVTCASACSSRCLLQNRCYRGQTSKLQRTFLRTQGSDGSDQKKINQKSKQMRSERQEGLFFFACYCPYPWNNSSGKEISIDAIKKLWPAYRARYPEGGVNYSGCSTEWNDLITSASVAHSYKLS